MLTTSKYIYFMIVLVKTITILLIIKKEVDEIIVLNNHTCQVHIVITEI